MQAILNIFHWLFFDLFCPTYSFIVSLFVNYKYGLIILIAEFIVFLIAVSVTKKHRDVPILPKILNFLAVAIFILIVIVSCRQLAPILTPYFQNHKTDSESKSSSPSSSTTQKSDSSSKPSTNTTPKQTTPSTQTQKQLYYSVSCSNCWNEACNHNGYSYGGYDSYWYSYYYSLCKSCSCNDFKAQSLWR